MTFGLAVHASARGSVTTSDFACRLVKSRALRGFAESAPFYYVLRCARFSSFLPFFLALALTPLAFLPFFYQFDFAKLWGKGVLHDPLRIIFT